MIKLLGDERLRSELGAAAARRARERFTSEKSAEKYAKLYEQLVRGSAQEVVAEAMST
jgi:glycosyltransferase involved in cell wall biosynthesis